MSAPKGPLVGREVWGMKQKRRPFAPFHPPAALATDLDGTLTLNGSGLGEDLVAMLLRVKRGGTKLILVTGRCTDEARGMVGRSLFHAMVAENGAVLAVDGREQKMSPPGWMNVRERLLPHLGGGCEEVILSTGIEKLATARRLLPSEARIELNKDRLMVLPRGVDKGRGLLEVLSTLGLPPEKTACLGDGENDVSMFDVVGIKVALANSVEGLKRKADFVTSGSDGAGAMEAIGRLFPERSFGAEGGEKRL
jgi:hydroxymethylpyrimidine pyrophosphatase-like HAD family hydrolase